MEHAKNVSVMRRINLIFRFSYTLPFFMASLCGSLFAWLFFEPPIHIVILMPLVVLMLAVFVNFSNDYFDHRSGVDKIRFKEKEERYKSMNSADSALLNKIYWEGNPFDDGLVTDKQGKMIMVFILAAAGLLAIPIFLFGGWLVLVFGGIGVFISYFYTAPPLDLGARGLGEVAVGASFFMLVFFSFYVATGTFDWNTFAYTGVEWNILTWEIFVFAAIVGTLVGLMRLTDSMSGQEAHIANGEKSIAVRFGLGGAAKIAKAFIIFSYLLFAVMFIFNPVYIVLFLTLPLTLKAWKIMTEMKGDWTIQLPPFFFGTAFLAEILFIAAVCVQYAFGIGPIF